MKRFEGKNAVITGGAAGIGKATAARLLAEGANVLLVDRDAAELEATRQELAKGTDRAVEAVVADIRLTDDVSAVADVASRRLGNVHALINNAGIPGPVRSMLECTEAELTAVFDINVLGTWRMLCAIVPLMPAEGGAVVNTASTVGIKAAPLVSIYGASKQAVVSLTKSAAVELASRGIRVNAVCPGTVETSMTAHIERSLNPADPGKVHSRFANAAPLRRYARAEEVAAMFAYLASDEAAYVTGAVFLIDGGATVA